MESPAASVYYTPDPHPHNTVFNDQTGGQGTQELDTATESLTDTLRRCIPERSAMMRSIMARQPEALLVDEKHPEGLRMMPYTPSSQLRDPRENSPRLGGSVLIIQDIDQVWGQDLISSYPERVHPDFLAKHMIRLDSGSAVEDAMKVPTSTWRAVQQENHRLDFEECLLRGLTSSLREDVNGFHIDCDFSSVIQSPSAWSTTHAVGTTTWGHSFRPSGPSATVAGFTIELGHLDMTPEERAQDPLLSKNWKKARTRLSYCQLEEQFYLVLVEAMPDLDSGHEPLWDISNEDPFQRLLSFSFKMEHDLPSIVLRSPIVTEQGLSNCMITTALRLFQHHTPQSVFQPKDMPGFNPRDIPDSDGKCHVLVWLLVESTWQLTVASLDSRLQRLRRSATNVTSDEAFSMLKTFRREIADARMLIAELRERFVQAVGEAESWAVIRPDGPNNAQTTKKMDANEFWSQERAKPAPVVFGRAQTMDIKNLPETLKGLEDWIHAMTQTVNEEIQVVIGSVQIEDARTMKRQAEWTVMLAALAAVYLPMTLVTGIFGMNIVEISTTSGAPSRWSVVVAWAVVFGATMLSIVFYATGWKSIMRFSDSRQKQHKEAQAQRSRARARAKKREEEDRADDLEALEALELIRRRAMLFGNTVD